MTTISSYTTTEKIERKPFFSSSIFVWLILVAYMVLVKMVILPLFPPIEIDAIAAIFGWDVIATASILVAVGLWIADRTGFMPALDPGVSSRQRYWIPLLIGGAIGMLASLLDMVTKGTQFIAENMGVAPSIQIIPCPCSSIRAAPWLSKPSFGCSCFLCCSG